MYKFIVTFRMKPETLPAVLAAAKPCIAATRDEPGCVAYDFYVATDKPDAFVAVECFRTQDDHKVHEATPHFQAFLPVLQANVEWYTFETISIAEAR